MWRYSAGPGSGALNGERISHVSGGQEVLGQGFLARVESEAFQEDTSRGNSDVKLRHRDQRRERVGSVEE